MSCTVEGESQFYVHADSSLDVTSNTSCHSFTFTSTFVNKHLILKFNQVN